jgi:hypothetical protein
MKPTTSHRTILEPTNKKNKICQRERERERDSIPIEELFNSNTCIALWYT